MHRILPSSAWTNENTVMTGTRYTGCQTGCIRSPRGSLFLAESSFWYRQVVPRPPTPPITDPMPAPLPPPKIPPSKAPAAAPIAVCSMVLRPRPPDSIAPSTSTFSPGAHDKARQFRHRLAPGDHPASPIG